MSNREQQGFPPRKMVNGRQAENMGACTVGPGWVQMLSLSEHTALLAEAVREAAELLRAASWHLQHPFSSSGIDKLGLCTRIEDYLKAASTEGGKGGGNG